MKISSQVSIIDIMPTLLTYIKRMNPELQSTFHGQDLTDFLRNPIEKQRFIYLENKLSKISRSQMKKGLCTKHYKIIKNQDFKDKKVSLELYDIENDVSEEHPLSIADIMEAKVLLSALKEFEKLDRPISSAPQKLRKELEKKLKALGYVQ